MILGEKTVHVECDEDHGEVIFYEGDLPPDVIQLDDFDLGCDPNQGYGILTPSLEGYWERDDGNGYLSPKASSDKVIINGSSPVYDEHLTVVGKIYASAGILFGADTLIYEPVNDNLYFKVGGQDVFMVADSYIRGVQSFGWYLNSTGTPPFSFWGDEDTGMYRAAVNSIGFTGGGNDLLILNADGSIKIPTSPVDDPTDDKKVLVYDPVSGILYLRDMSGLHTHSNSGVIDLLSDIDGSLGYDGAVVVDLSGYYTSTQVDTLLDDKSNTTHSHNLADLDEHSYNSLTEKPDLTDLHEHSNKATLDVIPDHTVADEGDIIIRSGSGFAYTSIPVSMVYPGVGIALSTGSAWDTSIDNNSSNWNTAYTHSQNNNQAHSDYVVNTGDTMTGDLIINASLYVTNSLLIDGRVAINTPISDEFILDVGGSGRFGGATSGQSIINDGLIVNNSGGGAAINDFVVKTDNYGAIDVSAGNDAITIMNNILGKIAFFGAEPSTQSTGWSATNGTGDKTINLSNTTLNELKDVVASLMNELINKGLMGG